MTAVLACATDDNKVVIVTDSAIGGDGYRRLLSQPKIWDMGCLVIGEAGDDFALSRIRQKTQKHKSWEKLQDPYTFSELIVSIQKDVAGDQKLEPLEAELLHVGTDEQERCQLHIIGGEGGVIGPFPYTAVGDGMVVALPLMDALIGKRLKKKTTVTVANALLEIQKYTARYTESVNEPFHTHIYDPEEEYKKL